MNQNEKSESPYDPRSAYRANKPPLPPAPVPRQPSVLPLLKEPEPFVPAQPSTKKETMAIVAFVLGLLGGGLLAVIFGHIALKRTHKGLRDGRLLAVIGTVLGYLGLIGSLLLAAAIISAPILAENLQNETKDTIQKDVRSTVRQIQSGEVPLDKPKIEITTDNKTKIYIKSANPAMYVVSGENPIVPNYYYYFDSKTAQFKEGTEAAAQ